MDSKKMYYKLNAESLIKEFAKRRIEAYYCDNKDEAVKKVLELVPENSSISTGGSTTLSELNIGDYFEKGNYEVIDRNSAKSPDEKRELELKALGVDYYLMSTNAMTRDGVLINIDGKGNRVAALIYGPENVIIVTGMNKLEKDEEAAMSRARNYSAPINALRVGQNFKEGLNTPCEKTGKCHNCTSELCICNQIVITRGSTMGAPNRIKVILVGEELGF